MHSSLPANPSSSWIRIWVSGNSQIKLRLYLKSEKAMAPHSGTLAWKILWTEEPGRLQSMGSLGLQSLRFGLRCRTKIFTSLGVCVHETGEGNGTPLQYSCLENPMDGGAWWAAVHGVAKSRHDWATSLSLFTFMHWTRKWQPTPVFLPGESQGRRSLVGCCLWGCTESDTTEVT